MCGEQAIPRLAAVGVRIELWLGEDDSLQSARYLIGHAAETSKALLAIAASNRAITGFNLDLVRTLA